MTAAHLAPRPARPAPPRRSRDRVAVRPVEAGVRTWTRQLPALIGIGMVMVALFALAIAHAFLIGGQREIDQIRRDIASETEQIRVLRLQVAELEAPERVLSEARVRFGMVTPPSIGYLPPLDGAAVLDERIRVDAAPTPPPVRAVPAASTPEQAAIDRGDGQLEASAPTESTTDAADSVDVDQSETAEVANE